MGKIDLSWMIMNANSYEFQVGGTFKWLLVNENRNITFWGDEYWMGLGCELKLFNFLALRGGLINHVWENVITINRGTVGIGFNFKHFWFDCSLRKNMPPSDEMVPWFSIGYTVQ
jgi:hypothetical protein